MIVINEKPTILHTNGRRLMPGTNVVEPSWWAKTRKHKSIQKRLELGLIVEETDFEESESLGDDLAPEAAREHLKTLKVAQAKALVEDTVDLPLLKAWLEREDRNQVKGVLKRQIERLEEPAEMRDRSKGRQIVTGRGLETIEVTARPDARDD